MKNIGKNNTYSVYKHENIKDGKIYIGLTRRPPHKRWGRHGYNYRENDHFYTAIKKYGWNEGFTHEIMFDNLSKSEAEEKEVELIAFYDSTNQNCGYNKDKGGQTAGKMTEETKKKISKANTGKRRTLEQKKHMSEVAKNMTDEHKQKMSEARKGVLPWNANLILSEDQKDKMKGGTYKPILCVETGVVYKSMSYAYRILGIQVSNLSKACNGERHTAGGYHWRYVNE